MIGLQIRKRQRQVAPRHIEAFAALPVANVSDCMSRMTAGGPRLRPMHKGGKLAGPALTVKARPGDNLMIHKALELAAPGDIIVVDAGGDLTNALFGELMLGDADGLLCVPYEEVETVLAAAREKLAAEQKTLANIAAGTHDTAWVDARLRAIGCDPTPR